MQRSVGLILLALMAAACAATSDATFSRVRDLALNYRAPEEQGQLDRLACTEASIVVRRVSETEYSSRAPAAVGDAADRRHQERLYFARQGELFHVYCTDICPRQEVVARCSFEGDNCSVLEHDFEVTRCPDPRD